LHEAGAEAEVGTDDAVSWDIHALRLAFVTAGGRLEVVATGQRGEDPVEPVIQVLVVLGGHRGAGFLRSIHTGHRRTDDALATVRSRDRTHDVAAVDAGVTGAITDEDVVDLPPVVPLCRVVETN